MVSGSYPMKAKIWMDTKAIGCGSDWTSISGFSNGITSSHACCGEKFCRKVENTTLPVYSDIYYGGFIIACPNRDNLIDIST